MEKNAMRLSKIYLGYNGGKGPCDEESFLGYFSGRREDVQRYVDHLSPFAKGAVQEVPVIQIDSKSITDRSSLSQELDRINRRKKDIETMLGNKNE